MFCVFLLRWWLSVLINCYTWWFSRNDNTTSNNISETHSRCYLFVCCLLERRKKGGRATKNCKQTTLNRVSSPKQTNHRFVWQCVTWSYLQDWFTLWRSIWGDCNRISLQHLQGNQPRVSPLLHKIDRYHLREFLKRFWKEMSRLCQNAWRVGRTIPNMTSGTTWFSTLT